MTKTEALALLAAAPRSDRPSRINPSFTVTEGLAIVQRAVEVQPDGELRDLLEKRVRQVTQNRQRPQ